MASVIEAHDGKLYVADDWVTMYAEPTEYRSVWPTGVSARDYPGLVGQPCKWSGNFGIYRCEGGMLVRLEDGGATTPSKEFSQRRPVKRPRWAKAWRYGQWTRW